jgi:hypothetical protein
VVSATLEFAEPALDVLTPLEPFDAFLGNGSIGGGIRCGGLTISDLALRLGDESFVTLDRLRVHVAEVQPKLRVGLRVLELQGALLVGRDHRDARVDRSEDLALRRRIDPVGELPEAVVELQPERDALRDRGRGLDGAKGGDVLVTDLAVETAGLDEADLQPVSGPAESGEHGVVALCERNVTFASFLVPLSPRHPQTAVGGNEG